MDWDALFWTPEHKVDTIRMSDVQVYSHLDPMDTTWTKGVHVYGCWSAPHREEWRACDGE